MKRIAYRGIKQKDENLFFGHVIQIQDSLNKNFDLDISWGEDSPNNNLNKPIMSKPKYLKDSQINDIHPELEREPSLKPGKIDDQEKKADQLNTNITKDIRKLLDDEQSLDGSPDPTTKLAPETSGSKNAEQLKGKKSQ